MGAGTSGLCQYLFSTDILGTNMGHVPRHAKVYANLHAEMEKLQKMRVEAYRAFKDEVSSGAYPEPKHLLEIKEDGSFRLNMDYFGYLDDLVMTSERFSEFFGGPPREPESPISR